MADRIIFLSGWAVPTWRSAATGRFAKAPVGGAAKSASKIFGRRPLALRATMQMKDRQGFNIGEDLGALIDSYSDTKPIQCGLTVSGHDYWWFLEYGSGMFFGVAGKPEGELTPPVAARKVAKGGKYKIVMGSLMGQPVVKVPIVSRPGEERVLGGYSITAHGALGLRGPNELKFFWKRRQTPISTTDVMHPGVGVDNVYNNARHKIGWVRRAVFRFEAAMATRLAKAEFGAAKKAGRNAPVLPSRQDLEAMLSEELKVLHAEVVANTSEGPPVNEKRRKRTTHLRDSWRVMYPNGKVSGS